MAKIIRSFLVVALLASIGMLGYMCVMSIYTPIEFEQQKEVRDKAVIKRLIDIRKVQVEFNKQNNRYTASIDTLMMFIKDGKVPVVFKEGTLSDDQLKNGLDEDKAIAIVRKGNKKEIMEMGLENFRRDTTYRSVYEELFAADYTVDAVATIFEVPFSDGKKFEINTASITDKSGRPISLFEAKTPYSVYLADLDAQELANLIDAREKIDKYPGLQVGSVLEANNNAGNWE